MSALAVVYACTSTDCSERFRGFTDEPGLWCSVCMADLTAIENPDGRTLDDLNTIAEERRPRPEMSVD